MDMEVKVLGIGDFRRTLSERIEAAAYRQEATVIKHGKRDAPRAALVPYEVGDEPIPIGLDEDVTQSWAVSDAWMRRARAALAATT